MLNNDGTPMTVQELIEWIEALEIECDGFEDGCERLKKARVALDNIRSYND